MTVAAALTQLTALAVNEFSAGDRWFGLLDVIRRHPFAAGLLATAALASVTAWQVIAERPAPADPPAPPPPGEPFTDGIVRRPAEFNDILAGLHARPRGASGPVTVVHGGGGFGKTTLVDLACADPRLRRRFQGRVYRIVIGRDATGPSLAAKVNELAELITGQRPQFESPEGAGQHLGRLLGERPRTLIIADDVWTTEQAAVLLSGGRRCARLFTSRNPGIVPTGARMVRVAQLTYRQARELLTGGVAALPEPLVQDIITAAGRWPLVLRMVNRVLREQAAVGADLAGAAATLLARIRAAGPAAVQSSPEPEGPDDPRRRQETVGTSIRAATDLLPPGSLERLAELAVFAEGESVPVPLAASLWRRTASLDDEDSAALCARLARLALLTSTPADGGQVMLHDTVRAYLSTLIPDERQAVLHDAILRSAPAGAGPGAWWRLDADARYLRDNLVWHLRCAGRASEAADLVADPRWLAARIIWSGTPAALADLTAAAGAGPTGRHAEIAAALATSADLFERTRPPEAVEDILRMRLHTVIDHTTPLLHPGRHRLTTVWPVSDRGRPAMLHALTGHQHAVTAVAVAPDERWIVSADANGDIRIWDRTTGHVRAEFRHAHGGVRALAVSPDGTLLAAAGYSAVTVWDVADTGTSRWTRPLSGGGGVLFSQDGSWLAVSAVHRVRRYDPRTGKTLPVLLRGRFGPGALATAAAAPVLAVADNPPLRRGRRSTYQGPGGVTLLGPAGSDLPWLRGHRSRVNAVALDSSGAVAVTGGGDDTVRVWTVATGECRHVLPGHIGAVHAVGMARDGSWAVSGGRDGTLRRWDAGAGTPLAVIPGHLGAVRALSIAPSGGWLVTGGSDGAVKVWSATADWSSAEPNAGTVIRRLTKPWGEFTGPLLIAPDGRWIGCVGERSIDVWDAASGEPLTGPLPKHVSSRAAALSPDGTWLAAAADSRTVRIWDTATWQEQAALPMGAEWLAVPADTGLLVGRRAGTVTVLDLRTARVRHQWSAPDDELRASVLSPDGGWIGTAGDDGDVRLRTVTDGRLIRRLSGRGRKVTDVAVAPGGEWIAAACVGGSVLTWDVQTGQLLLSLSTGGKDVRSVTISGDGTWLAASCDGGTIRIWDAVHGTLCGVLPTGTSHAGTAAASPDGSWLAYQGWTETVVWGTGAIADRVRESRDTPVAPAARLAEPAAAVSLAPDAAWVATAGGSLTVTGAALESTRRLIGHTGPVQAVATAPDGAWLASAGADGSLRLWETASGVNTHVLRSLTLGATELTTGGAEPRHLSAGHTDRLGRLQRLHRRLYLTDLRADGNGSPTVNAVAISADGTHVVWAGDDHTVRTWSPDRDAFAAIWYRQRSIRAVAVAPDGRWTAWTGRGTIVIRMAATGAQTRMTHLHLWAVNALAATPDGTHLLSAGGDGVVHVWQVGAPEPVLTFREHRTGVHGLAVDPGGELVASVDADGTLCVWSLRTGIPVAMIRVNGKLSGCAWAADHIAVAGQGGTFLFAVQRPVPGPG